MKKVTLVQVECEDCEGTGVVVPSCTSCNGLGSVRTKATEKLSIPSGVYTGLVLRSEGKGNQIRNDFGQNGDLLLKVDVESHELFKREAENITSEQKIPFTKAVFGGDVEVETLTGKT